MFRGESVQALAQSPRVMPPGTLPVDGEAPMSREVAAATLHNRIAPSAAALAAGKTLFGDNCTACHGVSGRGDGTVSFLLRIPPADLTAGVAAQRSDGYIYATHRHGVPRCPPTPTRCRPGSAGGGALPGVRCRRR